MVGPTSPDGNYWVRGRCPWLYGWVQLARPVNLSSLCWSTGTHFMALFPDWNSQISSSFHLSLFAIFMQLLDFPLLRFSFKLDSFEHASMFVSPPCHICKFYSFRMDISCFWYLFWGRWYFCSLCFWPRAFPSAFSLHWPCWTSRHYHWLLQLIVFVSLLAVLAPNRFHTALVLTIQLYFKDVGSRACYGFLQRAALCCWLMATSIICMEQHLWDCPKWKFSIVCCYMLSRFEHS